MWTRSRITITNVRSLSTCVIGNISKANVCMLVIRKQKWTVLYDDNGSRGRIIRIRATSFAKNWPLFLLEQRNPNFANNFRSNLPISFHLYLYITSRRGIIFPDFRARNFAISLFLPSRVVFYFFYFFFDLVTGTSHIYRLLYGNETNFIQGFVWHWIIALEIKRAYIFIKN